jgi:hypothetical protein
MSIPKPGAVVAAPEVAVEAPKKSKVIPVEAIEKGFYDNSRKNPGDKFHIKSEKEFSKNWMIKL